MQLDIRLPIGLLFICLGLILSVFGAMSDAALYQRTFAINVNLYWGLLLLVFGLGMGHFGYRAMLSSSRRLADSESRQLEGNQTLGH